MLGEEARLNKMKKNKDLVLFIVTILICILIVISLAIAIYKIVSTDKSENNTIKDSIISKMDGISKEDAEIINKYNLYEPNSYYSTMTVEEKKSVTTRIDEIIDQLNNRNYDALYSKLNEDYKNYKFPSQDDFNKYISNLVGDNNDYVCEYFVTKYYGVKYILSASNSDEQITLIVRDVINGDYEVYFDGELIGIEKVNELSYIGSIIFNYMYKARYQYNTNYLFELENISKNSLTISFDEVNAKIVRGGTIQKVKAVGELKDIEISAGEKKKVEFSFEIGENNIIDPSDIEVSCKINGIDYDKNINLDFTEIGI